MTLKRFGLLALSFQDELQTLFKILGNRKVYREDEREFLLKHTDTHKHKQMETDNARSYRQIDIKKTTKWTLKRA